MPRPKRPEEEHHQKISISFSPSIFKQSSTTANGTNDQWRGLSGKHLMSGSRSTKTIMFDCYRYILLLLYPALLYR